jgi:uncharacterized repeat protein (TIGR03803 family)
MKTKKLFLLPALLAVLNLIPADRMTAQTFTTLHSFTGPNYNTNSDGANPYAGLTLSGNTLYGTTANGGSSGSGTIFALNTDGPGFTNLHSFTGLNNNTNSDGANPQAGLILSGNTLYGTAYGGGNWGFGTVFAVNTDGTRFTNLHNFNLYDGNDAAWPLDGLILSGNTLYGTAESGGIEFGTVFALNTDGTGFRNLHNFQEMLGAPFYVDGGEPSGGLILSGSTLYGTTRNGGTGPQHNGAGGYGTVFALNTNGTGFTVLHSFTPLDNQYYTNSDGVRPQAGLVLSGDTLYGTAYQGGSSTYGTVFAVNTNGTGFTNLHNFTYGDGANPQAPLILSGNTLYGTAGGGGGGDHGTVFAFNTNGMGFTTLYSFAAGSGSIPYLTNSDGAYPGAGLILSGNTLYGTALYGGISTVGTVFSLSFRPQLTIAPSGTNVILSWPLSYAGFSYGGYYLEETANLGSPDTWISVVDTNLPVFVNGRIQVTRPMLGPQWSYRLRR